LSWVVAVAMLLHAFYFWGGVGLTPNVGTKVISQSMKQMDAFGVFFYAGTGRSMMGYIAPESARDYALEQVGQVYPKLDGERFYAAQIVRSAMTGMPKFTHFGTPYAFLIALLLYWRREKPIKSLGR
jgi:hypothetical protein